MAQTTVNTSVVTKQILAYYDEKIKEYIGDEIDDASALAIKAVDYSEDKLKFYKTTDKTDTPITIDLPEEQFLDQAKTTFVDSFAWSSTTYPGSTNPNLDGKPVLVLAVKGEGTTVAYSFVNLEKLIDVYEGDETDTVTVTVDGTTITADVKVSAKTGNVLKVETGEGEEGLFVAAQDVGDKADKVSGATNGNFAGLDSDGNLTDSGSKAADFVAKTTTIAGVDLADNITKDEMLTALNVEDGAEVNVIETVKVNGTALGVSSKAVNVTVATGSTDGSVAVNGTDVAVKGFSALASQVSTNTTDISTNASAIEVLNGDENTEGSVAYAIKQLTDGAVADVESDVETLNGDENTEGSVANKIKEYKDSIPYTNSDDIDSLFS